MYPVGCVLFEVVSLGGRSIRLFDLVGGASQGFFCNCNESMWSVDEGGLRYRTAGYKIGE